MSFNNDLKNGQNVEKEVADIFIKKGYTTQSTNQYGVFNGYDLIVSKEKTSYSIEVKHDRMVDVTGNVAIEISKKKDGIKYKSGLSTTMADYQVYKISEKYYQISTENLKKMLKNLYEKNNLPLVYGGQNKSARVALINKFFFRKQCEEL